MRGDASRLPFRAGSIRAMTCHFALMLLQPLEDVLSEVARVVAAGGVLSAVLPGPPPAGKANGWAVFRAAMAPLVTALSIPVASIQDERALDPVALGGLLINAGLQGVEVGEAEFHRRVSVDDARDTMLSTYSPDLLDGNSRTQLVENVTSGLEAFAADDGLLPMVDRVHIVRAVRTRP